MQLSKILSKINIQYEVASSLDNVEFDDIALDSRLVKKGSVFFALEGRNQDGSKFINDAINNGAVAIVIPKHSSTQAPKHLSIICEDPFLLLVEFLKNFYAPLPANVYAVTGTNGKTSVAEFTRQILQFLGKKSASIGTLGVICEVRGFENNTALSLTTPDIVSLYKNLYNLKKIGVDDVAVEVSSIGLEQSRVAGVKIETAAFTNFTQDHLDYHKSMQNYFDCKMILFEKVLATSGVAVLNADIAEFEKIKEICDRRKIKIIEYGFKARDLRLLEVLQHDLEQEIIFEFKQKKYQFKLAVSGEFQAFNALCALGNILAKNNLSDEELENLLKNFQNLHPAAGRMQRVAVLANKAQIFIDFAHSPDALKNVLELARKITKARVLVLFGCGGDRDAAKRPLMGKLASNLADLVIVTDDNPRTENPALIRQAILQECDKARTIEIAGRKEAIAEAIKMLRPEDVLILAGKGHEKYQIIGDKKFEFDEGEIVRFIVGHESGVVVTNHDPL